MPLGVGHTPRNSFVAPVFSLLTGCIRMLRGRFVQYTFPVAANRHAQTPSTLNRFPLFLAASLVKYLFKYVMKGHDCTSMSFHVCDDSQSTSKTSALHTAGRHAPETAMLSTASCTWWCKVPLAHTILTPQKKSHAHKLKYCSCFLRSEPKQGKKTFRHQETQYTAGNIFVIYTYKQRYTHSYLLCLLFYAMFQQEPYVQPQQAFRSTVWLLRQSSEAAVRFARNTEESTKPTAPFLFTWLWQN